MIGKFALLVCLFGLASAGNLYGGGLGYSSLGYGSLGYGSLGYGGNGYSGIGYGAAIAPYSVPVVAKTITPIVKTIAPISYAPAPAISYVSQNSYLGSPAPLAYSSYGLGRSYGLGGYGLGYNSLGGYGW